MACRAAGGHNWWYQAMKIGMGLIRNEHGVFVVRHKVPKHLEETVARVLDNGKDRQAYLQKTTGTKNKADARRIAVDVLASFQDTLRQAEALLVERPLRTALTPSEIKRLAEFHYAAALADDDEFTTEGAADDEDFVRSIAAQLDGASIEYKTPAPLGTQRPQHGLTDRQVIKRDGNATWWLENARAALARGDISIVSEAITELLDRSHINLDPQSPSYRQLGMAVLRADVRAHTNLARRYRGEPIETPEVIDLEPTGAGSSTSGLREGEAQGLSAAFEGWKKQHNRSKGVVAEYGRAIDLFIQYHGDISPARITRDHARTFLTALQDVPWPRRSELAKMTLPQIIDWRKKHPEAPRVANKSINKQFGGVQTIVRWARDDGIDPFANLRLEGADPQGGPFEPEELRTLFASRVFTAGARPTAGKGDVAFWLPLLALFTGARRSELAALKTTDINQEDGHWTLAIYADKDAGKTLKTKSSARTIPIHPELVRLGFLDFVGAARSSGEAKLRSAGVGWLFPTVSPAKRLGITAWSRWFGRYLADLGIGGDRMGLHSLRHNCKDALRAGGVREELNDALLGQNSAPSVARGYGARHPKHRHRTIIERFGLAQIVEAVSKVNYPTVDLQAVRWK
jgi:integrase